MKYFTADLHLGHEKVAQLRGYHNVEEHDEAVLAPLRELSPGDQLWVLGDISSGSSDGEHHALHVLGDAVPEHVRMHLVAGNHDSCHPMYRNAYKRQRYFGLFDSVQPFARTRINGHQVLLSHFPYRGGGDHTETERFTQYRLPDEGMLLLHGHTHATMWRSGPRSMCVSFDAWDSWGAHPVNEYAVADAIALLEEDPDE